MTRPGRATPAGGRAPAPARQSRVVRGLALLALVCGPCPAQVPRRVVESLAECSRDLVDEVRVIGDEIARLRDPQEIIPGERHPGLEEIEQTRSQVAAGADDLCARLAALRGRLETAEALAVSRELHALGDLRLGVVKLLARLRESAGTRVLGSRHAPRRYDTSFEVGGLRGTRGRSASGWVALNVTIEGESLPLAERSVRVFLMTGRTGPRKAIGEFFTDESGKARFAVSVPKDASARDACVIVIFGGDEAIAGCVKRIPLGPQS